MSEPLRENNVDRFIVVPLAGVSNVTDGAILSIQATVAVAEPVRHNSSTYSKVNVPFPVNVYRANQLLFVIVIHVLLNHVSVATTFPLVCAHDHGAYSMLAIGGFSSRITSPRYHQVRL